MSREEIIGFQNIYNSTLSSIMQLKDGIETSQYLHNQLDQAAVKMQGIVQLLTEIGSLFPLARAYMQPIDSMLKIMETSANNIYLAEQMLSYLNSWFSHEPDRGINSRVFLPVLSVFDSFNNEIRPGIESIQTSLSALQP